MSEHEGELPAGWSWATPPEVASSERYSLGIGPFGSNLKVVDYRDSGVPLVFVRNIRSGQFGGSHTRHVTPEKAEELAAHVAVAGDVLVTKMGEPPGDSCVYPADQPPAVVTADCIKWRVHPELPDPAYFAYVLRYGRVKEQILDAARGVAQRKVSLGRFNKVQIPVAPASEQRRIVDAIETEMSKLDAAVAGLERAQANLKRYRASVLQSAVEGRLVPTEAKLAREKGRDYEPAEVLLDRILAERRHRWEEAELERLKAKGKPPTNDNWRSKYKEPVAPAVHDLPELPEGWCWATLAQLSWDSSYGTSRKCSYDGGGEPVLRIPNVRNGKPTLDDMKHSLVPLELREDEHLVPGDFLIIRTNGSRNLIARAAFVQEPLPGKYFFASYLIRYRLVQAGVLGQWLLALWHSPAMRQKLEREAATSAGQYNVSQTVLSKMPVPLPPASEQARLGAEVERLTAVVGAKERNIADNLVRCERLRQSVLSWAFAGKLVRQHTDDEPASALLGRIQAGQVASAAILKPTRQRRHKTRSERL